jgi:hypothetical protein
MFILNRSIMTSFVPQIMSTTTSFEDNAVTSHTVNIPSVAIRNTGLLFLVFGRNGASQPSVTATASGWTTEYTYGGTSGNSRLRIYVLSRVYNGTESSTTTITTSASCRHGSVGIALNCPVRVSNGTETVYQDTSPATVDFPSHTMPTSGVSTLWCTFLGMNSASGLTSSVESYSSGYNLFQTSVAGSPLGLGAARSSVAFRYLNSNTETPGSANLTNSFTVYTNTIAIRKL